MAELLLQGFDAYWADRGNPDYDIACFWKSEPKTRATRLRVKTARTGSAIWTYKKKVGAVFPNIDHPNDFVVIVNLQDEISGRKIYVIPTEEMERILEDDHAHYVSFKKRDGTARAEEQGMRSIAFYGQDRETNKTYAYDVKLEKYLFNWDQLK